MRVIDGARTLYQEGSVASMRTPDELIRLYTGGGSLKRGHLDVLRHARGAWRHPARHHV